MHVLLVTYEFPPSMATGGIASYMYHVAESLHYAGHQVSVISANDANEYSISKSANCTNYLVPASDHEQFRIKALDIFKRYLNPKMIDVIESPEVGACALAIKEAFPSIPLVVKLHTPGVVITKISNTYQSVLEKLRFVAGSLLRGKLNLGYWSRVDKNRFRDPEYCICIVADKLVSPSLALSNYVNRCWKLTKEIKIVPNPFFADHDLYKFPIKEREKVICFVGKLTVLKGMFALTKAVRKILNQHPDYRFIFAGRDEFISKEIPSMRIWMENELNNISEKVEFTGALTKSEVINLLGRSSVCVVPSLWENYPTIVLEAMAGGAVVAAANRGGIPEIIAHKVTGILFDPLKPKSISNAVHKLLSNEKKRTDMAFAARDKIKQNQSDISVSITDIYESMIKNKSKDFSNVNKDSSFS